ncbi:hypothetical protein, partial [Micromonospora sp. NPDC047738]|uniref:hypothetical protein n=1 Tax=unclassified Micromonospora TaxID=2617518 RepID=UPI0033C852CC
TTNITPDRPPPARRCPLHKTRPGQAHFPVRRSPCRICQGYAYLHSPAGAAVLFLGWALGVVVYEIGQSRQMPLNARFVLGGSIVAWMLCGLGLHRFALGRMPRRRFIVGLVGIALAIVVTLVVTEPGLLLGLTSAILVGYAIVVSPQIVKATKGYR